MAGWSRQKRLAFEAAFYTFLDNANVNSKDDGFICLGEHLYEGQKRLFTAIFDGLEADIHKFFILKSRQLGITTAIRALSIFYIGVHKGLKGALVFDTASNREEARAELITMIKDIPAKIKFPKIKGTGEGNREGVTLVNDSKILFKNAGVKKSKSSGTLGRSVGLSMAHLSELCSYDNDDGLESFEQSLSEENPDRLYIYESTARGFNSWHAMWGEARKDPHCCCIFLGWWSKDNQRIAQDHPDFNLYGTIVPSEKELAKIKLVKEQYGVEITPEQLAWIRRKMDPTSTRDGDADPSFEGSVTRIQEQPWTEDEAFQQTGAVFFAPEDLTEVSNKHVSPKYNAYMFGRGVEFFDFRVYKAANQRSTELKVWEEPDPDGVYVLGADPAFGENENNDRSSIQVLRCYADGVDQVAEYASAMTNTRQFAWVIASLLGWYGAAQAEIRYILELNGPGSAVFNELRSLRHQIDSGYHAARLEEQGLRDVFRNVKTYIYSRSDSMGAGFNYHFRTTMNLKVTILERLRDFVSNGKFHIRSMDLVDEMRSIAREGDSISSPGNMKDDRVLAAALATHCWDDRVCRDLMTKRRTREAESARKRLSIVDQVYLFQQNQLTDFFAQKRKNRQQLAIAAQRQAWRTGRR